MSNKTALLLVLSCLPLLGFAKSFERGHDYYIENNSSERILITFQPNDSFTEPPKGGNFEKEINIGYFSFWEYNNEEIPNINSYINGEYSWKHRRLIRRGFPIGKYYIDDDDNFIYFEHGKGEDYKEETDYRGEYYKEKNEFKIVSGDELFELLVGNFVVSDLKGNVIMAFSDIHAGSFVKGGLDLRVEKYTKDFLIHGQPRGLGFYGNSPETDYFILSITDALIDAGRKKHAGLTGERK
jgi:hypothetical protein